MTTIGNKLDVIGAYTERYTKGMMDLIAEHSYSDTIPKETIHWKEGEAPKRKFVTQSNYAGGGNTEEMGAIPPAGQMLMSNIQGKRRYRVHSMLLSDAIMPTESAALAGGEKGTKNIVKTLLADTIKSWSFFDNIFCTRDGTGVMATVGATTSGSYITVNDGRLFKRGVKCEIRAATVHDGFAIGDVITSFTVGKVPRGLSATSEGLVYPAAGTTIADNNQITGDLISWGHSPYSSFGRGITGLTALIDDATTTFQGVNTDTYPEYTSYVDDGAGNARYIDAAVMRNLLTMFQQENPEGTAKNNVLLTANAHLQDIEALSDSLVRLTPMSKQTGFKGGLVFKSALGEITFKGLKYMQHGEMICADRSQIAKIVYAKKAWRPGMKGIFTPSPDNLSYYATMTEISDLIIWKRGTSAKLENIAGNLLGAY